ncbi:MAG TPA: ATPase, T2SS/T4P/T4SS family [Methylophilaceae bacterium]|nr:ATPase, T2SS/T4P/T4SS family [Methylophilaceae bacterium]
MDATVTEAVFDWPTPHYFSFAPSFRPGPETCLIYLVSGKKVLGELTHFSQQDSSLVYLPTRSEIQETLNLDQVKSMRLVHPLVLQKQTMALEERAEELFPPSEKQSYTVELVNKEILTGETIGYAEAANGLYLFLPSDAGKIIRCFIPRSSIRHYQIGQFIGEMLIEEKLVSKKEVEAALVRQRELRVQRLGDYLAEHQIVSREQLSQAIKHQESQPILKLGEALIQLELLTPEQLETALARQKQNRKIQLGQILIDMKVIDDRTLKGALAKKLGIPYVSLSKFNFDPNAIRLVSASFARKHHLVPLCVYSSGLVIAFEDPLNGQALEELRFLTQMKIVPAMASYQDIQAAIGNYYGTPGSIAFTEPAESTAGTSEYELHQSVSAEVRIDELANKLFGEDTGLDLVVEPVPESDNTLVQLVNKMIMDAHQEGVSDIHIETYPGKHNTRVRFRKDGSLMPYLEIPPNFRNAVISRIKIMAQLDISERRKPQDGKIDFQHFGPAKLELRVATIPTSNGLEDIVMRLLAAAKPVTMENLGLASDYVDTIKMLIRRPYGLLLVCGPTGSGKTTTLHSLLGSINTPDRKIWTAEDPIEISQPGLRQVQVNPKIGWTFANAMRSFLRGDPDVIMVGEMRDQETTKIGIEASLTGHLVLSTLHTNSAPESVVRLLDLGMDPFNFADALLAILAQRLAKKFCLQCREAYTPDADEIAELAGEFAEGTDLDVHQVIQQWQAEHAANGVFTLYKPTGCRYCSNTGYRGRLGLHELMTVNPAIKRLIQSRAPVSELLPAALSTGMRTLKQDGIIKVLQGHTGIAQVRAVCV